MGTHIAIIQGHPDASGRHFSHALADEYAKGAEDGGHEEGITMAASGANSTDFRE